MTPRKFGSLRYTGRVWQARWTDRNGVRQQKSCLLRTDAERALDEERVGHAAR